MKNKAEIDHIAELARLDPEEPGFLRLTSDFENIIAMIGKLESLDISDIQDTLSLEHVNALREDTPIQVYTRKELIENAPESEAGCVAVPKVME